MVGATRRIPFWHIDNVTGIPEPDSSLIECFSVKDEQSYSNVYF